MWGARAGRERADRRRASTAVRRYAACAWRAARGGDDRDRAQTHNSKPWCELANRQAFRGRTATRVNPSRRASGATVDRSAVGPFGLRKRLGADPLFSS